MADRRFSNILLLLRNGPGLRGLTIAYTFFAASQSTWSIQSMYRLGPLRWTSGQQGYFEVPRLLVASLSSGRLVIPFMERQGNRKAFEQVHAPTLPSAVAFVPLNACWIFQRRLSPLQGALVGALAYFLMAVSWMPRGASRSRMATQYCVAMFMLQSFPAACLHAIKAMMIHQGVSVTDAGKGKLSAAVGGLGNLAGIVMPAFVWAPLFKFFVDGSTSSWWLRWGPGGHFFVSGGCLLVASLTLKRTKGLRLTRTASGDEVAAEPPEGE